MKTQRYYRVVYTSTEVLGERHLNVMADNVESALERTADNCRQQGVVMIDAIAVVPSEMMLDMNAP